MIQIKNSALLPYVAKNNLTKTPALFTQQISHNKVRGFFCQNLAFI